MIAVLILLLLLLFLPATEVVVEVDEYEESEPDVKLVLLTAVVVLFEKLSSRSSSGPNITDWRTRCENHIRDMDERREVGQKLLAPLLLLDCC